MAHIYIYSPSGVVSDKAAFRRGVKFLQSHGHDVELDPSALARDQRFAGDDDTRLAAMERAASSGASIALTTRGGYGLSRLLHRLPYKLLAKAVDKGTCFVGLSDFTALQTALLSQTGAITWAGPAVCEGFGAQEGPDEIMLACFDDLVQGQGEGAGWRLPTTDLKAYPDWLPSVQSTNGQQHHHSQGDENDGWGVDKATLWGGNLSVLCSLLGTPYFPDIKGGVLFLEDVNEHPYRIERMLTQLLHAGVLGRQKAILLGQFTEYKTSPLDNGYKLQTVVDWLRAQLKVPVLTGLPFGHVPTKVLLPVGATVQLLVHQREAIVLWD